MSKTFVTGLCIGLTIGTLVTRFVYVTKSSEESLTKTTPQAEDVHSLKQSPTMVHALPSSSTLHKAPELIANPPVSVDAETDDNRSEFIRKIDQIAKERPLRGETIAQQSNRTGGTFTKERLSDGIEASREYNARGTLTGEKIKYSNGDEISRSFFETGAVKGVKWTFSNGTVVNVMQDSSGIYTSRKDEFLNGDKISYEYDDSGIVTKRWIIKKGQKPQAIAP